MPVQLQPRVMKHRVLAKLTKFQERRQVQDELVKSGSLHFSIAVAEDRTPKDQRRP